MTLLIELKMVSSGTTTNSNLGPKDSATHPERPITKTVADLSAAQFQGLCEYLACIRAGTDTSSVETAITAL